MYLRKDADAPQIIEEWGWKYHHIGIPTHQKLENEKYIPHLKFYVSGFSKSPYGIEWMRFEQDSPIHPLIQQVPHVAFEVEDLDAELLKRDFEILTKPNSPSDDVRVAMIKHNGAPVELIEFKKSSKK
ncbi:VOC family protein [Polaribacter cellanae]|uniref:Uncharacterized protein n=1 Tax=Polaribacter cellanae TaxID=2818493 RepID=A0A975CS71_9FLAO|nr:hypothetical protein [Polaribacter cellanae]QTE24307.1 hypothetical protein J3359_08620 [Polaribacter cellanae]